MTRHTHTHTHTYVTLYTVYLYPSPSRVLILLLLATENHIKVTPLSSGVDITRAITQTRLLVVLRQVSTGFQFLPTRKNN